MDPQTLHSEPPISERLLAAARSMTGSKAAESPSPAPSTDTARFLHLEALLIKRARLTQPAEAMAGQIMSKIPATAPAVGTAPLPISRIILTIACLLAASVLIIDLAALEEMPTDLLFPALLLNGILGLVMALAPQAAVGLLRRGARIHPIELLLSRISGTLLLGVSSFAMNTL